jgi:hypothetical protein
MTKARKQAKLHSETDKSKSKREQVEALERNFRKFHSKLGKRTWKREDLYERLQRSARG